MRTVTYRDALREAIREEMLRDERVFILGEDIAGDSCVLSALRPNQRLSLRLATHWFQYHDLRRQWWSSQAGRSYFRPREE